MGREFRAQMMTKSMAISTLITVVIILAVGIIARIFWTGDSGPEELPKVGTTQSVSALDPALSQAGYEPIGVEDNAIEELVEDEDMDLVAVVSGEPASPTITAKEPNSDVDQLTQVVTQASSLISLGDKVDEQTLTEIQDTLAGANEPTTVFTDDSESNFDPMAYIVGLVTVMLMYMAIVMGVSMLAMGVVEEKSSRIVEILLTTIRPRQLLLGKILGIGSAILLSVAIYIAAAIASAMIAGVLPEINIWSKIPFILMWVVLGYFLYASLTGGAAATITRQEEIGTITTPIILLSMVPFYMAFTLVPANPESTVVTVSSMMPFFSPFLMPVRAAFVDVPLWQTLIAIGVNLIAIPVVAAISGKIYERSILHTGKRKSILSALRGQ